LGDAEAVNVHLEAVAVRIKNRKQKRDPEMHQTKKGQQLHFGINAHVA
jgi:hypothetical protein